MDNRERARRWTEIGYLVCLCLFLTYRAFFNTKIRRKLEVMRCKPAELSWLLVLAILILIRAVYVKCYSIGELLVAGILCAAFLLSWTHARVYWFLMVPLLIVGAKGVSFERIGKAFLITVGGVIGLALILSLIGVIPNLEYIRYADSAHKIVVGYRYAYGTTYPTTFSEFVFFLCAVWLFLRRQTVKFYDVIVLSAVSVFLYKGPNAVTDAVCVAGLAVTAMLMIVLRHASSRAEVLIRRLLTPMVMVSGVCAAVMTVLMILYDKKDSTWKALNKAFHSRLSLGRKGLEKYGIHLFGSKVTYRTSGGNPAKYGRKDYFNLDSSYHMILINFGIVILVIIVAMFTLYLLRAWQKKDLALALIVVLISLECVMENRMIQPQYNIFLLMLFADMKTDKEERYTMLGGGKR